MRPTSRSPAPERGSRISGKAVAALLAATAVSVYVGLTVGNAASLSVNSANLTTFSTCSLSGSGGGSASVFDSYVDQNGATANNATATTMDAESRNGKNRRPYLQFNLTKCSPSIPSSATVKSATLKLWVTGIPATCRTEDVFAATSSWTESGITWNNQPFGTTTNNPASGSRTDSVTVGSAGSCTVGSTGQYATWTVIADVSRFVAGPSTNYGWMIRDDSEDATGAGSTVTFGASNAASIPQAPQLVVVYKR
jgi:hypothetical protein